MRKYVNKLVQRTQAAHSQVDTKNIIYVYTQWLEQEQEVHLLLLLTTNNETYKGALKYSDIRSAADDLDKPFNEFFDECKAALTSNMGLLGFDYDIDTIDKQPKFKMFKCQGFETLYLEVDIRKVSNSYQLLDAAIELATGGQLESDGAPGVVPTDAKYNEILTEYKQYVDESKMQERKMLKKFILLVNSKKERIKELEDLLKARRTDDNEEDVASTDIEEVAADDDYSGETQTLSLPQPQPGTSQMRPQRILDDTMEDQSHD